MQKGSCSCGTSLSPLAAVHLTPGALTYELDDDSKGAGMCYCRDCMKTSSGGCVLYVLLFSWQLASCAS